jgi:LacI family transcriptional regulator, galactose operon repressor
MDPHPSRAPVTIADVARRAGVGVGTVSRVLNQSPQVRPSTRERVETAIDELDFRPSAAARSLSLGRTQSVGVVVPLVTSPSAMQRLSGFISVMTKSTYDVVLFDVEQPSRADEHLRRLSHGGGADGVLVVSLRPSDEQVERFVASRTPVVLLDAAHPRLSHVTIDDVEGGRLAAGHLLGLGHRRIAFVGDAPTGFGWDSHRRRGFEEALRAAGIEREPGLVREGVHGREVARAQTGELLAPADPPTAVFAASDTQALGVLDAARDAGVPVPGGLSVIGFDDLEVAEVAGLTTVRQPLRHSGVRAAELLLELVAGRDAGVRREVLPLEVVARETTGPPAA